MPPGRSWGGGSGGGGRGRGLGRGGGGGRRPRGRGGRSSGRGTALPSSFTGRGGGAKGGVRRGKSEGDRGSAGYEFDDGGGASDRHKYDDEAGDSDDGPGPEDSDFEDEEVDEDAAFDSADEARYGEVMDTILQRRSGKQVTRAEGSSDDEEDESEHESDDDGGEGVCVSVMDMLAANEAEELAQKNGVVAGTGKGKGKAKGGGGVEESSRTAEVSSAESSEGDAMDDDVSDEEPQEDDSDDDEDEDERHARLMGFVGALGDQAAAAQRAAEDRRSSQLLKEGEFNSASGGLAAGGGGARKGAVTMETLMGSLQKSKGFAAVKKQVAAFSGKSGAPAAPVSKTAELRAEREMAYDNRKSDMGKWVAPVQANRKAETLDFAPTVKTNLSNAALASKMEATTDMEKEVEMLLTAGGASEAGLAENEMEELKSKAYTVEEVKERQAELSKMRALMFYQERKQHHMNKIKSKVYRKIKKRQRDRAGDVQQEGEGELGEVAARKRAEERMSLRHKNTSKWVKNALRAKGGAGKDDRKAIAEQLQIGQELRAKMGGVDRNSSEDSTSSEEEEGEGGASNGKTRRSALKDTDRVELERIGEDEDGIAMSGKGAALMKMAFMQKAMDKQRERAREEASVVLKELEEAAAAANADGSDDDEAVRRNKRSKKRAGKSGGAAGKTEDAGVASKETRAEATAEVAKALPAGALQSSAVSMDARVRSSVASPITIDLGGGSDTVSSSAEDKAETLNRSNKKSTGGGGIGGEQESSKKRRKAGADGGEASRGQEEVEEEDHDQQDDENNPWLVPTPRRTKSRRRAPNGEVLLDVRKAAATALSAFGGGSAGGKEGPSASGDAMDEDVEHEGGGDAEDAGTDSVRPLSSWKKNKNKKNKNNSPPSEQAEQEQGGGRKKRKRRKRGGGGSADDASGREGASGAGTNGEGAEARAATDKAGGGGGNKKAKTASEPSGKSGVKKSGEGSTATPKLAGLSNDELVRRAFAAPDFESEFKDSKDDEIEGELAKGLEKLPGTLAGWGAWAGDGAPAPRGPTKRQVLAKNAQVKKEEAIKKARKDDRLPKVVLNEKRQKRSAKYMVSEVPYPFTSREQYERSLRQPIGGEWNTSQSVRAMTRPAVVVRAGVAVAPMKLGKIHRDNARERSAVKEAKGATQAQAKKRGGAGWRRGN
ncbi:unnamed protein product [Ectocarpus sp. CCAP 1310/34]|nr:unnamed protein product [Ectocarpus sp. CCAP 1310/34]